MIGIVIMIEYWGIHVVGKGTWKKREVEKFLVVKYLFKLERA